MPSLLAPRLLRLRQRLDALQSDRPLLVFLRHASLGDTVIAATYLGTQAGRRLRYVVKHELVYDRREGYPPKFHRVPQVRDPAVPAHRERRWIG